MFVTTAVPSVPNPAERLALILDALQKAVAAHGIRGLLTLPLQVLLWSRLSRMAQRARRLGAKIAAGVPLFIPRIRAPRHTPNRPYARLPGSYVWLIRAVPGTAFGAVQLRWLLTTPEMAALAESPPMRRLLRPLCRMLGVDLPTANPAQPPAAPPPIQAGEPSHPALPPRSADPPPWPPARPTPLAPAGQHGPPATAPKAA